MMLLRRSDESSERGEGIFPRSALGSASIVCGMGQFRPFLS